MNLTHQPFFFSFSITFLFDHIDKHVFPTDVVIADVGRLIPEEDQREVVESEATSSEEELSAASEKGGDEDPIVVAEGSVLNAEEVLQIGAESRGNEDPNIAAEGSVGE